MYGHVALHPIYRPIQFILPADELGFDHPKITGGASALSEFAMSLMSMLQVSELASLVALAGREREIPWGERM